VQNTPKVPALPRLSIRDYIRELTIRHEVHSEKVASELIASPET
jgi:hypothetical protein